VRALEGRPGILPGRQEFDTIVYGGQDARVCLALINGRQTGTSVPAAAGAGGVAASRVRAGFRPARYFRARRARPRRSAALPNLRRWGRVRLPPDRKSSCAPGETPGLLPDTPVGMVLNAVRFSPPRRAPLRTPLQRGWVELWDIETARFSVASSDASAVVSGFRLAETGSRSDAEAPYNRLCFPFHPG